MAEKKKSNLPLLHVQSIRLFHVSLKYSGGKDYFLLWKGKFANFKSGPTIYLYQMVEEHCSVHSIQICKGSSCIVPLSLSFGIKQRWVLNITPYHFTPRQAASLPIEQGVGWSREKLQVFCERRKFLASNSIQTAEHPVCSLASILTWQLGSSHIGIKTLYVAMGYK